MTKRSTQAVLQAAAKVLVWDLYAAVGYCRSKSVVDVERFDRALLSAVRAWRGARANLAPPRRNHARSSL
jgi:hypothetical protein